MPRHSETRHLPYTPEQIFDLVADVGAYPDFLPWCIGARVYDQREDGFFADLIIGFKVFKERFTSKVTLERPDHVHVDYIKGPLRYLHNDWRFEPAAGGGTNVHFTVDFEFKNKLFESLAGALFTEAVNRMVGAFERRAVAIYG